MSDTFDCLRCIDDESLTDCPLFLPKISGRGEPIRIYDGRRSLAEAQHDPDLTTPALLDETKAPKSATAKGEIHYLRDSDDERPDSDEDPDDDLDI